MCVTLLSDFCSVMQEELDRTHANLMEGFDEPRPCRSYVGPLLVSGSLCTLLEQCSKATHRCSQRLVAQVDESSCFCGSVANGSLRPKGPRLTDLGQDCVLRKVWPCRSDRQQPYSRLLEVQKSISAMWGTLALLVLCLLCVFLASLTESDHCVK